MWHENPLTKFDDNTDYFVCLFVFSNVCSLNLWFASVINKFDLGYIKTLFQTTLMVLYWLLLTLLLLSFRLHVRKILFEIFFKNTINYKGIHDNVSLERLHKTKQKLKDALSCLLHLKNEKIKCENIFT